MCGFNMIDYPADTSVLRQLDHQLMQKVRLFIKARVANLDDSEDLLQATFLEALRNEHKFRNDSSLLTWLCGIALNLIRSHFRRLYKQPFHEDLQDREVLDMADSRDLVADVGRFRELERVAQALEGMPTYMQEVIRVAMETGGNYLDTSVQLGVPIGTVRSRLSRARVLLRQKVRNVE